MSPYNVSCMYVFRAEHWQLIGVLWRRPVLLIPAFDVKSN